MARIVAIFAVILAFIFPYSVGWEWSWWKFLPSTAVVILLVRWLRPRTWVSDLGLNLRVRDLVLAASFLIAVCFLGNQLIGELLISQGFSPGIDSNHWGWKYLSVFQALNEEMLVRAFLLTALASIISSQLLISVVAASIFAFLHYALYQFGKLDTALNIQTLGTLFLFALAGNAFFFATRNIAIPYAIHVGWNINRFGQDWTHQPTGQRLQEAVGFNIVEGSHSVFILAALLAGIAMLWNHWGDLPTVKSAGATR